MGDNGISPPQGEDSLAERVAARASLKGLLGPTPPADAPPPRHPPEAKRAADEEMAPAAAPEAVVAKEDPSPAGAASPAPEGDDGTDGTAEPLHLNFTRLQTAGFLTPNSPRLGMTEEFRVIKRKLLQAVSTGDGQGSLPNGNTIMVTSCLPGEGKTYVALNLAMSFTNERDLHVLLIDGDSHRHSLSAHLGAERFSGLVDLLLDPGLQVRSVLHRTNIPNLTILSSGKSHPNSTELLGSKQAGALMQDLSTRYRDRIIIIDTPPVLASTEAAVLSSYVGQTIVVVEKDRTSKRNLHRAMDMLEGCPSVSCVLNMAPPEKAYAGYDL